MSHDPTAAHPHPSTRWLEAWHDAHAGATSRALSHGRGRDGRSSYERLAARVPEGARVLDLACGDGLLMSLITPRRPARLAGVDLSQGELDAARARLGAQAELVRAPAEALPFADDAFDVVVCHMALMLFPRAAEVVAEVGRVLTPGGRFEAIMSGPRAGSADAWTDLLRLLQPLEMTTQLTLGDPRVWSLDGLADLFDDWRLRSESFTLALDAPLEQIWSLFMESYDPARLRAEDLDALRDAFFTRAAPRVRPDHTAPCAFGMLHLSARR